MLHDADLEAAVAGGIVTTEQAVALRALAEKRERERAPAPMMPNLLIPVMPSARSRGSR